MNDWVLYSWHDFSHAALEKEMAFFFLVQQHEYALARQNAALSNSTVRCEPTGIVGQAKKIS